MRAKISILIGTVICLAACKKDSFSSTPQLTFKSVNTTVVPVDGSVIFTIDYTDKEGDIQDSFYVAKILVNNCNLGGGFTQYYQISSDVPAQHNAKGEIEVRYSHGVNLQYPDVGDPRCSGNDTCVFKFALTDKAGHISDTVSSPPIVIIKR
jgi:hypothetical protein